MNHQYFSSISFGQIEIERRKRHHCDRNDLLESTDMQRDLPIPNRNLEGLPGLNLEANIDFDFYQAKSISFDAAYKAERDGS